jgi:hypothetical protein
MAQKNDLKLLYINNVRIVLIILIIMLHIAITYGAEGNWIYTDPVEDTTTSIVLTIFNAVVQSFALGFFFMISGYFTPGSYLRKGPSKYLKDRFIRLGVPLFIYFFIINPIMIYILYVRLLGSSVDIIDFFSTGPLWFVEALLIFCICYHIWRRYVPEKKAEIKPPPKHMDILKFALMLSVVNFIVRIWWPIGEDFSNLQFGFFPGYISLFIIGTWAYKNKWFDNFDYMVGKRWLWISVLGIPLFPIIGILGGAVEDTSPFLGGAHWQSAAYSTWEAFVGTGLIAGLFITFRKRFNSQTNVTKNLSENAYSVFIIHAPVIVFLSYSIREVDIHPLSKFALVAILGLSLCFVISHYVVRRIPYAKKVL